MGLSDPLAIHWRSIGAGGFVAPFARTKSERASVEIAEIEVRKAQRRSRVALSWSSEMNLSLG
jgi:hypothetical protein